LERHFSAYWFRSKGNPLVGLDLTGASQQRQLTASASDVKQAGEMEALISEAKRLPLQLSFCFEVRTPSDRLVSSAPE
jgi:hypothetical protein